MLEPLNVRLVKVQLAKQSYNIVDPEQAFAKCCPQHLHMQVESKTRKACRQSINSALWSIIVTANPTSNQSISDIYCCRLIRHQQFNGISLLLTVNRSLRRAAEYSTEATFTHSRVHDEHCR